MKKIKRKAAGKELKVPLFVIGYAAPEPPPPGFLAAWFDQEYGGPLTIQLPRDPGTTRFEAQHGPWSALVETSLPLAVAEAWRERLQWSHPQAAQVLPLRMTGDRSLRNFRIADHLRIEQVEGRADGRVWFHTRGLSKFGLEDIETYRPTGLSERPVIEAFTEIAEVLTLMGKAPNVGESFMVEGLNRMVRVVRHRTDQSYSLRLNLREVEWE